MGRKRLSLPGAFIYKMAYVHLAFTFLYAILPNVWQMLTLISFPTLDTLAEVNRIKQTSSRIKLCPKTPKEYFLSQIWFTIKNSRHLTYFHSTLTAVKPVPTAAGSRWQSEGTITPSERQLEFECRKCFIKGVQRPGEGWFCSRTGLWF